MPARKRKQKWTKETFLKEARNHHGTKYDYSYIKEEKITKACSKIEILCTTCEKTWITTIRNHVVKGKGCRHCWRLKNKKRNPCWTLERFLIEAKKIHGAKYDYHCITFVHGAKTDLKIICFKCGHTWICRLTDHIHGKKGCANCAGIIAWTYETFLVAAKEIHRDTVNYELISKEDIKSRKSKIWLLCEKKECFYYLSPWQTDVGHHLRGHGCLGCAKNERWDLDSFLKVAIQLHGDTIDYSDIKPEDITNRNSEIKLRCTNEACPNKTNSWATTVWIQTTSHSGCPLCSKGAYWTYERFLFKAKEIHGDSYDYRHVTQIENLESRIIGGCPTCASGERWTFERFLEETKNIHGDVYNYELVKPEIINNIHARFQVICNKCNYIWETSVDSHLLAKSGCRRCNHHEKWSYDRFMEETIELYDGMYDYSKVEPADIQTSNSYVQVICRKCQKSWYVRINNHINQHNGCPTCRFSHGEQDCAKFFQQNNINYIAQFRIPGPRKFVYDFLFEYDNIKCLLEFDGEQHFEHTPILHRNEQHFEAHRTRDKEKSLLAIQSGFKLIRIDYRYRDKVDIPIGEAITLFQSSDVNWFMSSVHLYEHISNYLLSTLSNINSTLASNS